MLGSRWLGVALIGGAFLAAGAGLNPLQAQTSYAPPNHLPNPYHFIRNWAQLPDGRKWGAVASVDVGPDGNIWVLDRCGSNTCAESNLDPILEFAPSGKLLKSFGGGLLVFPHGLFVESDGDVWVTDTQMNGGKGQQVIKFSTDGKELMRLGKAGVAGGGADAFNGPSDVVVAKNGDIFVADGHVPNYASSRIVKFSKDGKFIMEFGKPGSAQGQLLAPHALALDSKGRLYVADRGNSRVEIFDQNGKFIAAWTQFGRPSGIFIDRHDILYVTDSESTDLKVPADGPLEAGYGYNPGCHRGIRLGSIKDGKVKAFIPDPMPTSATSAGEGVAVDHDGNVYSAEVGPKDLKKYAKR